MTLDEALKVAKEVCDASLSPKINEAAVVLAKLREDLPTLKSMNWNPGKGSRDALEHWEAEVSGRTTSGHRLSISPTEVAGLWKTLADALSELDRARNIIGCTESILARLDPPSGGGT